MKSVTFENYWEHIVTETADLALPRSQVSQLIALLFVVGCFQEISRPRHGHYPQLTSIQVFLPLLHVFHQSQQSCISCIRTPLNLKKIPMALDSILMRFKWTHNHRLPERKVCSLSHCFKRLLTTKSFQRNARKQKSRTLAQPTFWCVVNLCKWYKQNFTWKMRKTKPWERKNRIEWRRSFGDEGQWVDLGGAWGAVGKQRLDKIKPNRLIRSTSRAVTQRFVHCLSRHSPHTCFS